MDDVDIFMAGKARKAVPCRSPADGVRAGRGGVVAGRGGRGATVTS